MPRTEPGAADHAIPVHPVPTALARRFAQICVAAIAEAIEGSGLTPLEYAVLRHLDYEAGSQQNGLATRLGIDQSNASLLVEQLVSEGLIERRVDGADRRARLLQLTARGRRVVRKFMPKTRAANDRLLAALDPAERDLFVNLLVRVVESNRVLDRPGAGRRKRGSGMPAAADD
jgi:DNA-binding MarR family transcriptional regulator